LKRRHDYESNGLEPQLSLKDLPSGLVQKFYSSICSKNEGVVFDNIVMIELFRMKMAETRKPKNRPYDEKYFSETYDLANSYVIGDRYNEWNGKKFRLPRVFSSMIHTRIRDV